MSKYSESKHKDCRSKSKKCKDCGHKKCRCEGSSQSVEQNVQVRVSGVGATGPTEF